MATLQDLTPKEESIQKFQAWLHEETTQFQPNEDENLENCIDPSLGPQCITLLQNLDLMDLLSVKPVQVTLLRVSGEYYAEYTPTSSNTIMLPIGALDNDRKKDPRKIMTPGFATYIQNPIWVAPGMECLFIEEFNASERLEENHSGSESESDDSSNSSTIVDLEGTENGDSSTVYREDRMTIAEHEFGQFDTMADLERMASGDSSTVDNGDTGMITEVEFEEEFGKLEDLEHAGLGLDFLDDNSQLDLNTPEQSTPKQSSLVPEIATPVPILISRSLPHIKFWLPALLVSEFIINLDSTLQITTLSTVSSSFNALNRVSWIGTAFFIGVITASLFLRIFTEIFGKKTTIISYHLFYILGALISSFANIMQDLCAGRAVQGIGAGGSILMVFSVMEDAFEAKENGSSWRNFRSIFSAIAIALGPLLGAAISDRIGWRWIYRIQLPFIFLTLLTLLIFFPNLKSTPEPKIPIWKQIFSYNIPGSFSLISATILFYIGIDQGSNFSWGHVSSYTPLVLAGVLGAAFLVTEYFHHRPIIPHSILKDISSVLGLLVTFCASLFFWSSLYYVPIFYQVIHSSTALRAALYLLPGTIITGLALVFARKWPNNSKHIGILLLMNTALAFGTGLAFSLLLYLARTQSIAQIVLFAIWLPSSSLTLLFSFKNFQSPSSTTVTTSLQTLSLIHALGSCLGIALYSVIVQTALKSKIRLPTNVMVDRARQSLAFIGSGDSKEVVGKAYAVGVSRGLGLGVACMGVGVCGAVWLVCEGRMGSGKDEGEIDGKGEKEEVDASSGP